MGVKKGKDCRIFFCLEETGDQLQNQYLNIKPESVTAFIQRKQTAGVGGNLNAFLQVQTSLWILFWIFFFFLIDTSASVFCLLWSPDPDD